MLQPASEPAPWSVEHGQVLRASDVRVADGLSAREVALRR